MHHRFTNTHGIELIKKFEGFSANIYRCPAGFMTIGYGHRIKPGEDLTQISKWQAEELLAADLCQFEKAVMNYINVNINDNQFAALVSFAFNLGQAALQRSSLRHKINFGLYEESADEFLKWVYCQGRKSKGLALRRYAERVLFLG